jgi:hypothetical protein
MAGGETTPPSQWTASSSSSYAGMNQIKFAGLDSISAQHCAPRAGGSVRDPLRCYAIPRARSSWRKAGSAATPAS